MAPQGKSRLLQLPPELRNGIYSTFFEDMSLNVRKSYTPAPDKLSEIACYTKTPALLLTCRKIHEEAIGLYYSNATFSALDRQVIFEWVTKVPAAKRFRNQMTSVRLDVFGKYTNGHHGRKFFPTASWFWKARTIAEIAQEAFDRLLGLLPVHTAIAWQGGVFKVSMMAFDGSRVWTTEPWKVYQALVQAAQV